jgi:hypothetical protein
VSFGILNGYPNFKLAAADIETDPKVTTLQHVAIINVNKRPGKSVSYPPSLHTASIEFKEIIMTQIEYIQPDVIICGKTMPIFFNYLEIEAIDIDQFGFIEKDSQLWINAYHPSYPRRCPSRCTPEEYYCRIIENVQKWCNQ